MSNKLHMRSVIFAALVAAWGASGVALAVDEVEPNQPATSAQRLVFGSDGTVQVNAIMGVVSGTPTRDVDFYSFEGKEGDVITVDIDTNGTRPDTILALFAPNSILALYDPVDDATPLDPGSAAMFPGSTTTVDARIDNARLPVTGTYIIMVSSVPGYIKDINTLTTNALNASSNGAYTLTVSGVMPSIQQINILVKPDTTEVAPMNPKAKGRVPVALLSSKEFDAMEVNQQSLRFGAQGNEESFVRCNNEGRDYNGDGLLDLVCHFDNATAGFEVGDTEGFISGETKSGKQFEGHGYLKVVGGKRSSPRPR